MANEHNGQKEETDLEIIPHDYYPLPLAIAMENNLTC